MRKAVIHANIVLPDHLIHDAVCCFTDGIIDYIGASPDGPADEIIDARGAYLLPGFIDIHCHGGLGLDFTDGTIDDIEKMAKFHLSHGTTTLVATTMTAAWNTLYGALDKFSQLFEEGKQLTIHGVHMEGPWFNPAQCGAQDTTTMDLPDTKRLKELASKYPFIERVSAAPELPNGLEFGRVGRALGLVVSAGHTDAVFDEIIDAANNGYTLMTHLYSGMKLTERKNMYRVGGAVEAGLYDDRLYVELITDGKHLPINLLKMVHKIKGTEKICLITDATRGAGLPEGTKFYSDKDPSVVAYYIDDGVAKLADGTAFCGSVATTDRLVRVMHQDAGIDLVSVSRMISGVPANVMGYSDRGSIEIGKRADFVLMDQDLRVNTVIFGGEKYES
jgi:N-acetylglucosamine-6-phosphate deacetylase